MTPSALVNSLDFPVSAINCSATSTATLTCASSVLAPKWGVATTFGCWINFKVTAAFGGSSSNTSNAAPPHIPLSKALSNAASSIIPPLATLIILTPRLHEANALSLIKSAIKKKLVFQNVFLSS